MELIIKNIQTIFSVLSEYKIKIAIILLLIVAINVFLNIVVLNKSKDNITNKDNEEN